MPKFVEVTCIGSKEIKRKDGNLIYKNYIIYEPIERDTEGKMCSVLWGEELIPGEVYDKGITGYDRAGNFTITSVITE